VKSNTIIDILKNKFQITGESSSDKSDEEELERSDVVNVSRILLGMSI